jgi:hypothetical protein
MSSVGAGETSPPRMPGWQLALRFGLEVASLIAWGVYARRFAEGALGYVPAVGVPLLLALLWGVFAVKGDPSRSGKAPVAVPGWARLALEMLVFVGGAVTLALRESWVVFALFAAAFALHHALTTARLSWLLRQ